MVLEFKEELNGERIVLKKNHFDIKLAQQIFEVVDENREYLSKWLPWAPLTKRVEDTLIFLQETENGIRKGTKVNYGIFLEKKYIGNIGVFDIDEDNRSAEVGYWLSQNFGRNGYITEALRLMEKELFENLRFNRIQIKCDELNNASAGVALKCGYVLEGMLREDTYVENEDRFRNTQIYSKLKSEYSK